MLNLLGDYIWDSLPREGAFVTGPGAWEKVDQAGNFKDYFGNTVIFFVDQADRETLTALQRELYDRAGDLLAQPIHPETFHLTLHDLVSGPAPEQSLGQRMAQTEAAAKAVMAGWSGPPLQLRATAMFNMVNTSVVLGFAPADEDSHDRLDAMYMALDRAQPLERGLTPHITLAYFRPGTYGQNQLAGLRRALRPVEMTLRLRMEDLKLQNFRNMNTYTGEPVF